MKRSTSYKNVYNRLAAFVNRVAEITFSKSENRYDYGEKNLLPNILLKGIEASVTASSCRTRKAEFIGGVGFVDNGAFIVNPDQTADELRAEMSDTQGVFNAVAAVVKYNPLGEPKRLYMIPFSEVRKTDDGHYYHNENIAKSDQKKDRVYYDVFDPNEDPINRSARVKAQMEEHGEQIGDIIYAFPRRAGQVHYPIPTAWAGMEDIESDAALSVLDHKNILRGFRPDVIITTIGEPDDDVEDEHGRTEDYYFKENLKGFIGPDSASILNLVADNKDELPQITVFDSAKQLNQTTEASDRVGKKVCRAMEVPEVLVSGFAKAGQLGNVNEINQTVTLFSISMHPKQDNITGIFKKVFPALEWEIEPLNVLDSLPQYVIEKMTDEEIRAIGNLPLLETKDASTSEKLSTLNPLVATKVLDKMGDSDVLEMVGLEVDENTEGTGNEE